MKNLLAIYLLTIIAFGTYQCSTGEKEKKSDAPFIWENATVYFLLTDRFNNGSTENDLNFGRTAETREARNFMGGDIQGITQKIEEGYFTELGIDAIWLSPVVEQIHGYVDEGQGDTYAYHGYWTKDWTSFEPNFGSEKDFKQLIEVAHSKDIRILLDVVINQTGPVTDTDPVWPNDWVRTHPRCSYQDYVSTITCTLVENLPDIKTDSNEEVELPQHLIEKWKKEGRFETEMASLNAFFERTGYPRAPRFYIIKWLTDYIRKYGIDGFRVDTVKHVEEGVWSELWKEAVIAFEEWKKQNPDKLLHNDKFYMVGEVYGYNIYGHENYYFSDSVVNYFNEGFHSLINFAFKEDVKKSYEEIFSVYSDILHDTLNGEWVMNYLSSHDDSQSYDRDRKLPKKAGTKLLLSPGAAQIYYGDELARILFVEGEDGDANLRSFMNWNELENNTKRFKYNTQDVLAHWQKLGKFRQNNPAVGAGVHTMLSEFPYVFKREYSKEGYSNKVVVGLDMPAGKKEIPVEGVFENGSQLTDAYSGQKVKVRNGTVTVDSEFNLVLLSM
jgi:alpha-amylase